MKSDEKSTPESPDKSSTRIQPLDETNRRLEGPNERKGTEEAKEELKPSDVLGHVLRQEEEEPK